jgi:hypothetical protein
MELGLVPHQQLIQIYLSVRAEIRRRKKARETWHEFKPILRSYEERFPGFWESPLPEKHCGCLGIPPKHFDLYPTKKSKYLKPLLFQDWDFLFPDSDPAPKYYVYAHIDPYDKHIPFPRAFGGIFNMPFYIGKGCGGRAYDLNRNQGHGLRIRELLAKGVPAGRLVKLIKTDLTERAALSLESKLIYFFGTIYEEKRRGVLLNLDIPDRPDFKGFIDITSEKQKRRAAEKAAVKAEAQNG